MAESEQSMVFANKLYDKLKFIALILLPALATLYITLDGIWGLRYSTQVVGTITALDTFLGLVLRVSTTQYYKLGKQYVGEVTVTPEDGGNKVVFSSDRAPEDLVDEPGRHSLEFKVTRPKVNGS